MKSVIATIVALFAVTSFAGEPAKAEAKKEEKKAEAKK